MRGIRLKCSVKSLLDTNLDPQTQRERELLLSIYITTTLNNQSLWFTFIPFPLNIKH